jgi:hypothetical protein
VRRRAALIATAVTVPLVLIVGLLLGHAQQNKAAKPLVSAGPIALSPITVAAPPPNAAANTPCTAVLDVRLDHPGRTSPRGGIPQSCFAAASRDRRR